MQVRYAEILERGKVETKQLAKHRERVHKVAIEPGSPRTFFSCGEDGVVRHVSFWYFLVCLEAVGRHN